MAIGYLLTVPALSIRRSCQLVGVSRAAYYRNLCLDRRQDKEVIEALNAIGTASPAGEAELLLNLPKPATPHNWSPDGKFLLGNDTFVPADIYALDLTASAAERKLIPIVHSPQANEVHPRFSPDGKWFAYVSNESGTEEIYVRPWDDKAGQLGVGGVTRVSKNGARGGGAMWKRDGKELYYLAPDGTMMAVEVSSGTTFSVGTARPLFKLNAPNLFFFDVTADGKQFVMPMPDKPVAMMAPFKVVLNWTSTLKK